MSLSTNRPSRNKSAKDKLAKALTDETTEKVRLNAEIDKALYKRIQQKALDEERSVSEITRALWSQYLDS